MVDFSQEGKSQEVEMKLDSVLLSHQQKEAIYRKNTRLLVVAVSVLLLALVYCIILLSNNQLDYSNGS